MISNVERLGYGRVRVTFDTGAELVCMDDGSFVDWLGDSEQ